MEFLACPFGPGSVESELPLNLSSILKAYKNTFRHIALCEIATIFSPMRWQMKENWLTQKPRENALGLSLLLSSGVFLISLLGFLDFYSLFENLIASPRLVFEQGEYWRAWSTLFLHGDLGHLLSNGFLFLPLSYFFFSYFSSLFFPLVGIFAGGIVNLIVLSTMPPETQLLGISGVVYWMGAAWITLFLLLDQRLAWKRKFGNVLFLCLMLFVPETLKPGISHLSHLLGFLLGIGCALVYYRIKRAKFLSAAIYELKVEQIPAWFPEPPEERETRHG